MGGTGDEAELTGFYATQTNHANESVGATLDYKGLLRKTKVIRSRRR